MLKIIKECPHCGKEFETRYNGKKTQTYCSNECYRLDKGIGVVKKLICQVCGKEFPFVHGKGVKTCSKECASKLKSIILSKDNNIERRCKCCGEIYLEKPWVKGKGFCSSQCYGKYRKLHSDEYENVFKERKESTHETRICEMCGTEFNVYKKVQKRFCSDECRKKYQSTLEYKDKRLKTMLERYGKIKCFDHEKNIERYQKEREKKYEELCNISDLTLLHFIDKHILEVKCNKCGKVFITNNLSYIHYSKIACKECGEEYKDYKPALQIKNFLDELGIKYSKNNRKIISPFEIDFYLEDYNIGIEINGNFWHSELCGKDRKYHLNKSILCNKQGIKLIHIFEDEIVYKWEIVKSKIRNLLQKNENRIFARKCEIRYVDNVLKKDFLFNNHIQGTANSSINLGLFYNEELVSLMTFSGERAIYKKSNEENVYELIRYATKLDTNVLGGFSKLLKFFIKNYNPSKIKSFCDVRWSCLNHTNTVYTKNGFEYVGTTQPNYWYMHRTDLLLRKHRYNFTKHSILAKHTDLDNSKTEWELMQELGYNRIWDCGNMKFEWRKK